MNDWIPQLNTRNSTTYERLPNKEVKLVPSNASIKVKYMLDGLQSVAENGFELPDDIVEMLMILTQSDVELDDSLIQADMIGELAVITLGAIEDESIEDHLRELQSMDDLPIETRRAATKALKGQ